MVNGGGRNLILPAHRVPRHRVGKTWSGAALVDLVSVYDIDVRLKEVWFFLSCLMRARGTLGPCGGLGARSALEAPPVIPYHIIPYHNQKRA